MYLDSAQGIWIPHTGFLDITTWRNHILSTVALWDPLLKFLYVYLKSSITFKIHFHFFTLVNIVSHFLYKTTGRAWERTSCEQIRHLKHQYGAHSNTNWWCLMVQLMNSCCFNLSLQTNAFIKMITRKLKMFHFLFSVYGIFLSHCVGFKTISVIINQYNGWLERENKAFKWDEK